MTLSSSFMVLMVGVAFSMLLSINLIFEKRGNKTLKNLLFIIFSGISLYYCAQSAVLTGTVTYFPFIARGFNPYFYLIGPSIYFYMLINLNESFKFKKIHLIHLIPSLYAIIDNIPFYSMNAQELNDFAIQLKSNFITFFNYQGLFLKAKYNLTIRTFLMVVYILFAWKEYSFYIYRNVDINEKFIKRWLLMFLIFVTVYVFSLFIANINGYVHFPKIRSMNTTDHPVFYPLYLSGVALLILSIFVFMNPRILYGVPRITPIIEFPKFERPTHNKTSVDLDPNIEPSPVIKTDHAASEKLLQELTMISGIVKQIESEQMYTDSEFNLQSASAHFGIPSHHLSYLVNNHLNRTFPEIINSMKVTHASALMRSENSKKYTIEAIGKMSGFQSRTTFYTVFKKQTGLSPQEYLLKNS